MSSPRWLDKESAKSQNGPRSSEKDRDPPAHDPAGQSPEEPIEFEANTEVARGNEERANAEPEPPALHDAQVPGKPDASKRRREAAKHRDDQ